MGTQDGFHHRSVEGDRHKHRIVDARDWPVLVAQYMTQANEPVVLLAQGSCPGRSVSTMTS